jgi:hypothetical protein
MKTYFGLVLFAVFSLPSLASAGDCASMPWQNVMKLGQISPTKARAILKTRNFAIEPKLLVAIPNQDLALRALTIGLNLQKGGNEPMVYVLDALAFIAKGDAGLGTIEQNEAYRLYLKSLTIDDYYGSFQFKGGVRLLATLRIMGRNHEADIFQKHLQGAYNAGTINVLRVLMSNTGHFANQSSSIELCEKIELLK